MPANAVEGFLPSRHGFRFRNSWPASTIEVRVGPMSVPIGNADRGLCGGMVFAARDRFDRGETPPAQELPPRPDEPLFDEIVDRQLASFRLLNVPFRFWVAALSDQSSRDRVTALEAWPAIKAEIDAGHPAMVGLVREPGWNPFSRGLGHQVVAYRYEESASKVSIWVYDPNEPLDDDVVASFERRPDGTLEYAYRPMAPLIGLLSLPYDPPST
jgi:hypothetical protein